MCTPSSRGPPPSESKKTDEQPLLVRYIIRSLVVIEVNITRSQQSCLQSHLTLLVVCCRFPPVCIDVDTLIKGVEEGQLAVRRALTPYAGSVPPAAVSDSPQSSSRASESASLDMLESLASAELDDESGSSGDESDEEEGQSRAKLQERYKWLLQQRAALQQQLEKLQNGRQTKQKEST